MADKAPLAAGRWDGHWHIQNDSVLRHLPPKCCEGRDFTITTRWHLSFSAEAPPLATRPRVSACGPTQGLGSQGLVATLRGL